MDALPDFFLFVDLILLSSDLPCLPADPGPRSRPSLGSLCLLYLPTYLDSRLRQLLDIHLIASTSLARHLRPGWTGVSPGRKVNLRPSNTLPAARSISISNTLDVSWSIESVQATSAKSPSPLTSFVLASTPPRHLYPDHHLTTITLALVAPPLPQPSPVLPAAR